MPSEQSAGYLPGDPRYGLQPGHPQRLFSLLAEEGT
jgi:hypothetical protein